MAQSPLCPERALQDIAKFEKPDTITTSDGRPVESGRPLGVDLYLVIRAHNLKPAGNMAHLFKKYRIAPASGRKALAKLLKMPVPRGLTPGKMYITKCTVKERHDGPQQSIIAGEGCTVAEPMLKSLGNRYEFPHDYQQDDTYATAKVYRKRWYRDTLAKVAKERADKDINWPCIKLIFVLHSYMSVGPKGNGACYASHSTIAERAGLSRSSRDKVCKQLKNLVRAKMLCQDYTRNGNGKVTAVYFPDNNWFVKGIKSGLVTGRTKIQATRTTEVSAGDEHILEQLEKLVRGEPWPAPPKNAIAAFGNLRATGVLRPACDLRNNRWRLPSQRDFQARHASITSPAMSVCLR